MAEDNIGAAETSPEVSAAPFDYEATGEAGADPTHDADVDWHIPAELRPTVEHIFGDRLTQAWQFARMLATDGVVRGLIGPREVSRLWDRHILNCAVIAELIDDDADVLDIGSGAGLPGIPLAIVRPDVHVSLVEPMERRVTFLTEAVASLGLDNVEVVRARAEEVAPKGKATIVTCRAVATIDKLASWCLPLLRPGGELLAIKGASAPAEVAKHGSTVTRRQGGQPEVLTCGESMLETATTVIRIVRRR